MLRHLPPSLRRRAHLREPKARFIIFCEGKNTEPAYFKALSKTARGALFQIETMGGMGVAYSVAEAAVERSKTLKGDRRRTGGNYYDKNDQVWAVFDRDEHPRYEEAIALCKRFGVGVGLSNPCFELWLLLHEEDYDKPSGRHEVQRRLQELRPEYDRVSRKIPDCVALMASLEVAETRAEKQLDRRFAEGLPYGPPSTTVFHLTQLIHEQSERSRIR